MNVRIGFVMAFALAPISGVVLAAADKADAYTRIHAPSERDRRLMAGFPPPEDQRVDRMNWKTRAEFTRWGHFNSGWPGRVGRPT